MKTLFLIADGMGDWPLDELGSKTVMQAARTPNMDKLAADGLVGRAATIPPGMPPGSDIANMALLGFDPARLHTGRGPIEAAAQGLDLGPDDLVWRLNLVTVTDMTLEGRMLDYSAGHIPTGQAEALIKKLQENVDDETFSFVPGIQYRHLLLQPGGALAPEAALSIRPPHDITDQPIRPDLMTFSKSPHLWDLVFEAHEVLARPDNPAKANAVWPWGQGRPLLLPDFKEEFGLVGAVISAVDLIKGLGRAAGMEVLEVEGATGLLDTNYEGKVAAALDFLTRGDFVFLHVEAPDECGHAGDPAAKIEAIERFDERVAAPLLAALDPKETAFLVACDHLTPIARRTHVDDPVPFLLAGPGVAPSGVPEFSEKAAESSGLLVNPGHGLLAFALKALGLR
ncbi:MAG: cofactor-independent phosphoglycerate mutase [Desulfovibrionaceae bacterium]